jgi:Nucleotidyl transferase AbiEii toxin, Type IV TA system
MPVASLHRQVATIVLPVAAQYGFAVAGGNALIAHGITDRFTQDLDLFTNREGGVEQAARAVQDALEDAGLKAEWIDKTGGLADIFEGMGDGLAEWIITAPSGEQAVLQLAYFGRNRKPVAMDIGPVLDVEDVVGWKTVALASRVAPRDYLDIAAALQHYTPAQLIGFARRLDPGLTGRDFAEAGARIGQISDREFAAYGLSPEQIAWVREQFEGWPR